VGKVVVDEAETPKILEELSKSNSAPIRKRSERQKRTALKRATIILIFLFPILVAVLFLGYQQWDIGRELSLLANENNRLLSNLDGANSRIGQLESTLNEQTQAPGIDESVIEQLRRDFRTETERLNTLITSLQNRPVTGQVIEDSRWQLVEAEHLMRIANQQLQLTGNVMVAVAILESADRILADSGDARVFPVRQALGSDLAQLRRVDVIDTEGLYIRLTNLQETVDQLPLTSSVQDAYRERLASQPQPIQGEVGPTVSFLDSSVDFLRSVFIWRKWENAPDLMYPPQQGVEIKRNVNLMLEQAQLALMMRQPDIYRESLGRSKVWIEQYLTDVSPATAQLVQELDSLLAVELNPVLPDISQSLGLIRQVSLNRNSDDQ